MTLAKNLFALTLEYIDRFTYLVKDSFSNPSDPPAANDFDAEVRMPCIRPLPLEGVECETVPALDSRMTTLSPIESDYMTRDNYIALVLHTEKSYTGGRRTAPPPRRKNNARNSNGLE